MSKSNDDNFTEMLDQYIDDLKSEMALGLSLITDAPGHSTGSIHGMHTARDAAVRLQSAERIRGFYLLTSGDRA